MADRSSKRSGARPQSSPPMFVGRSAASLAVHKALAKAVKSRRSVLVSGAPGTGKRTIAELLHHFAAPDAPALDVVRIDSRGRFGTIGEFAYLGPIEQLSLDQQARLPNLVGLGRLILGTRLSLESHAAVARLSPKLLRWCGTTIELPSLAERIDDIEALAMYFLARMSSSRPFSGISAAAIDRLQAYAWPGNVTELEAVIQAAVNHAAGPVLDASDLPPPLRAVDMSSTEDAEFSLELAQRRAMAKAVRHARGNKRQAARLLGIGKSTLYRKLEDDDEPFG
jgi:DNA-binding NtrC family response regulator